MSFTTTQSFSNNLYKPTEFSTDRLTKANIKNFQLAIEVAYLAMEIAYVSQFHPGKSG